MNILKVITRGAHAHEYSEFFQRSMRPILSKKKPPRKIYHYTDIYGFKGILENNSFWISHIDFLNDKTEIKYTFNLSQEILLSLCKDEGLNEIRTKMIMNIYELLIDMYFVQNKKNYYSLSFCINPDSNLLWSNYSQNDGYCIMFDYENLVKSFKDTNTYLLASYVNYDVDDQKTILKSLLKKVFNILKNDEMTDEVSNTLIHLSSALELIHMVSIFFKDECFAQEEEFRIALHTVGNDETYQCRISSGTFIPYIERKFHKDVVSGVTIGPKNNMDINLEGLRKFLELKEIDISPDEIKKSRIPYRF